MPRQLTPDDVRRVAQLSRLRLTDDEVQRMATELSAVLAYISKLEELDVAGVEPMAHAMDMTNVLREDTPSPGRAVDTALANAPAKDPPFFKVPKVLGEGSGA